MADEESSEWMAAQARIDRARGLFLSGKLEEAAMEIRRALAVDPDRGDWHHNLAVTLDAQGRHAEAMASYERALDLVPNHAHALIGAAQGSIRHGKPDAAVTLCERATRIDTKLEPAYSLRIMALGMLQRWEESESVYFLAQQYLTEMPLCLAEMANVLAAQAKYERAIWCFRESIAQNPKIPGVKTRLGLVLLQAGQPEPAHQVLLQSLRDHPGDARTLVALGSALETLGRSSEAEEKYRHTIELEPANQIAHVRLGDLALRAGRLDEARSAYSLVLSLGSKDPAVRLRLVEVLARLGMRTDAKRHLEEMFVRGSAGTVRDAAIAYGAAGAALECGTPAAAVALMRVGVSLAPADAKQWIRYSRALLEQGERAAGMRAARRALRLDRNAAEALHNVALDSLRHDEIRRAFAAISRGLRHNPSDEGLRKLRLHAWGKRAVSHWRAAVDLAKSLASQIRSLRW